LTYLVGEYIFALPLLSKFNNLGSGYSTCLGATSMSVRNTLRIHNTINPITLSKTNCHGMGQKFNKQILFCRTIT